MENTVMHDEVIRPRRVLSFIPASILNKPSEHLFIFAQKCLSGETKRANIPDSLIFDLEDSVPLEFKSPSIEWLGAFMDKHENLTGVELVLRVNAREDLPRYEEEFELASRLNFDAIMLPKVDRSNFSGLLEKSFKHVNRIIPIIETVKGYRDKDDILSSRMLNDCVDSELQNSGLNGTRRKSIPAVAMGLDDFSSDMRLPRDHFFEEPGFVSFITGLSFTARGINASAIGPVYNRIKDHKGLIQETMRLKNMGYRGSLCVFPPHVRHIKSIYTPSGKEVSKAHDILNGLEIEAEKGKGWFFYEEVKYDTADIPGLQWVIEYAKLCERLDSMI